MCAKLLYLANALLLRFPGHTRLMLMPTSSNSWTLSSLEQREFRNPVIRVKSILKKHNFQVELGS